MAMGQTVPSPRAEAQRPRGECEQHQSHSGVISLSMPWVPRQGIRTLLLLMSHPCYSRERLGGLFSVWVSFTWESSSGTPTPQQRACTGEMLYEQSWRWMRLRFGLFLLII